MHFSDSHLGRKHPSKIGEERVESGLKAFEFCIQKAIDEEVDFIVHSGDVFDTVYPWHTVIDRAKEILERLKQYEIPMYVIRGNHDRSFGRGRKLKGLAIDHLENGYVKLIDPEPENFPENGFIDHENVRIYGLGYHSAKTPEILEDFDPEHKGVNVLLLHDFVEGVTRSFSKSDIDADSLAVKNIDYIGIGHDHQPNQKKIRDTYFVAPGGTVDYDFNSSSFDNTYTIVETGKDRVEQISLGKIPQTLELKRIKTDRDVAAEQLVAELDDNKDYALKISVETDKTDFSTKELESRLEEHKNVLAADVSIRLDIQSSSQKTDVKGFSIDEAFDNTFEDPEDIRTLHSVTGSMLSDDQNLTGSGFNLNKDARTKLQNKVEEVFFDSD